MGYFFQHGQPTQQLIGWIILVVLLVLDWLAIWQHRKANKDPYEDAEGLWIGGIMFTSVCSLIILACLVTDAASHLPSGFSK